MSMLKEYQTRFDRVASAVQLKETDRVPLVPVFQAFPVYYSNTCTVAEAMSDFSKAARAFDDFYRDFQPDLGFDPMLFYPTNYMERSGINWFRWPGKHIEDPNMMYQFIEGEYMKQDEYEEAIFDITKFMMNKWIPRSFSNLSGLSKIDFRNSMWFGHMGSFANFADPEVIATLESLVDTGKMLVEWFGKLGAYQEHMKNDFGIPVIHAGFAFAPFDMIGDSMRGTVDILIDMLERPDELLRLIDVVTNFAIQDTIASCSGKAVPYVWFWLHKGVDEMMSSEQFAKFYWPSLLRYVNALVDAGLTPVLYVEGAYNNRLNFLQQLPKGKVICSFEYTDMQEAKKALGGQVCIMGDVPATLLAFGEKEEVTDYCKNLIDTCAPGGGFIMDSGTMIDNAKPENVEAMFETTFTYGKR